MNSWKKGCCFQTIQGEHFLIVGDAIVQKTGERVYLCQELTGVYRLMVWTEQEILENKTSFTPAAESLEETMLETSMENIENKRKMIESTAVGRTRTDWQGDSIAEREMDAGSAWEAQVDTMSDAKMKELHNWMLQFLETSSYSAKLELLGLMKGKITDSMLESLALSLDYELGEGSTEEKCYALERFLRTKNRYEGSRLR